MGVDVAITGAGGQLGRALQQAAAARGLSFAAASSAEVPVEDAGRVEAWLATVAPRAVVHGGAWTDVDGCEKDPERARRVNADGTANVARACAARAIPLAYVSTDFVFDGAASRPYAPEAPTAPLSEYGRSKLGGEQAVLAAGRPDFYVVRTSWVFGPGGKNFPKAILARAHSGQPLAVVTDQRGRPTYAPDLADALLDLLAAGAPAGVYHAANVGECSWHGFARAVLDAAGMRHVPIAETTAATLARPAARPAYSVLDTDKLDRVRGRAFPTYQSAIERYLRAEQTS